MTEQGRENELRRMAEGQGLMLRRLSQEDPGESGFQLVEPGSGTPVTGDAAEERGMSLDEVERWLTNDEATPQAQVVSEPDRARKASKDSDPRSER